MNVTTVSSKIALEKSQRFNLLSFRQQDFLLCDNLK